MSETVRKNMKHAFTIVLLLASGIVFSQKKLAETADKKDRDRATILNCETRKRAMTNLRSLLITFKLKMAILSSN